MSDRRLTYLPLDTGWVRVVEGGAPGVARFIDSGEWTSREPLALLLAKDRLSAGADLFVFDTEDFALRVQQLLEEGVDLTQPDTVVDRLGLLSPEAAQQLEFRSQPLESAGLEPPAVLMLPGGYPGGVILSTARETPPLELATGVTYETSPLLRLPSHLLSPRWAAEGRRRGSTVRRTPHLNLDEELLAPGASFEVEAYADTSPAGDDEEVEEIRLTDTGAPLELEVWLVTSSHFSHVGEDTGRIVIDPNEERSSSACFTLRVADHPKRLKQGSITALFAYQGRPCGRVQRRIRLRKEPASTRPEAPPPAPPSGMEVERDAVPSDMTIRISERIDGPEVRYPFRVTSRDAEFAPVSGIWKLPSETGRLVGEVMRDFTQKGASNGQRIDSLKGAGMELFELAPPEFKDLLWRLADEGKLPRTIFIVSSEPHVPWELMVPTRDLPDGSVEERAPLGVEFVVGRWIDEQHRSPGTEVVLANSSVVAPSYTGPNALAMADEEAEFVRERFEGVRLSPSSYELLKAALASRESTLFHFVCHGKAGGTQSILLDPNETWLGSPTLRAALSKAAAFRKCRPLVFLNACEVGRQQPTLVGTGGFAEVLIDARATGVIAPLWSVRSEPAHDVARLFYELVSDPDISFAEAIRQVRRKAYEDPNGEDTYAAYCFFGDPNASQAPRPAP